MKILLPALALALSLVLPLRAASLPAVTAQNEKLKAIRLSLDFNNATLEEAVMFLRVESKRLDPAHQQFNFIISPQATAAAKPVTVTLNKVVYEQALQTVCELAGVKYVVEANDIRILAPSETAPDAFSGLPAVQPGDKAAAETLHKLAAITIDRVNFQKLDVAAAIQFLSAKSRELDPEHAGINFVLGPIADDGKVRRQLSLTLDHIPLGDLIREIEAQTGLHASINDNIVTFRQ